MSPSGQFILDLGHRPALGREDFLVAPSNADAVRWLDLWPDWPGRGLVVYGPEGCGKSHLAGVWRERSGAEILGRGTLATATANISVTTAPAVVVEDIDAAIDEPALLHLYNAIVECKGHLLLTAAQAPKLWALALPDLRSRISALPSAAVAPPDDQLLAGVLVKLFADRQLAVGEDVILYLVARMERSFAAARALVEGLDRAALSEKRRITVPLIRNHLDPP